MQDESTTEKIPFRGLKRIKQETGSYCGPAVLQILLSHFGVNIDQEKIVDGANCRDTVMERGMSVDLLASAVKNLVPGMSFWVKRLSTLADLEKIITEYKLPVAVDWQGEFSSNDYSKGDEVAGMLEKADEVVEVADTGETPKGDQGHYSVMSDISLVNGYVRVVDPYGHYAGQDRFFASSDFFARWWDDRLDYLPGGGKKYIFEDKLMFLVLPANLRWPEELGMREMTTTKTIKY
jgi:hypothetical protein